MRTDLVIVGAGAAATHTLLAVLDQLTSAVPPPRRPVDILVVDRDAQFFSGVAYGNRSGRASLTLSTLAVFLPDDERARFIAWLQPQRDRLLASADPGWVERHRADVEAGRWEDLFVPRRWYGEYLGERATTAIAAARSAGVADVSLRVAEVGSIERSGGRFLVRAADTVVDAAAVVLAAGSPPTRRLPADDPDAPGLVHDVYDPGLDATLARLRRHLGGLPVDARHVLVVGGNASALEFVLVSRVVLDELGGRLSVLAPGGRPRNWRRRTPGEVAELPALTALQTRAAAGAPCTAAQLYEAVASDLGDAVRAGTDVAAVRDMVQAIPSFLPRLSDRERTALATRYGLAITNRLRQDCGDAVESLESAVERGVVDFVAGHFLGCRSVGRSLEVTVRDGHALPDRYGAVVGAVGFESVSGTRDTLVRQLLDSGIVVASDSDAGFRVDDGYRAAPGVYVVGPLLAGNAHPTLLVWHAESVRRIMALAPEAAASITRELILVVASGLADGTVTDSSSDRGRGPQGATVP